MEENIYNVGSDFFSPKSRQERQANFLEYKVQLQMQAKEKRQNIAEIRRKYLQQRMLIWNNYRLELKKMSDQACFLLKQSFIARRWIVFATFS